MRALLQTEQNGLFQRIDLNMNNGQVKNDDY
jgi:hypothetical protein